MPFARCWREKFWSAEFRFGSLRLNIPRFAMVWKSALLGFRNDFPSGAV